MKINKVMRSDSFTEAGRQRIIRKAVEILNASKIESAQKFAARYKKDYLDKK